MQTKSNLNYNGLTELLNLEVMGNYNHNIVGLAVKHSKAPKNVIDFGAGIGTLSLVFRNSFDIEPVCVEVDKQNKDYLGNRGFQTFDELSQCSKDVDLVFSSNVLEHIEDDVAVLRAMSSQIKKDGKIFLYLPAKMRLWSELDEEVGHYRRYEYSELKYKCWQAGLNIEIINFADSIGFFATFALKIFGYNKSGGIGSVSSLRFYDKWIFPVSLALDKIGLKYLFGKNIVLVATKQHQ